MTASPGRRSFRPDTHTVREAEALVKDWPDMSPAKAKRVAALLRSGRQVNR